MELKKFTRKKCKKVELFKRETVLKKIFAVGTSKLFRKECKYTTETKKMKYFIGKKLFQNLIWRSIPLDALNIATARQ